MLNTWLRLAIRLFRGDVHCGKSLLCAVIQWVFDGKLFTKLTGDDDISAMLAYADGNINMIDDVSSYQL